MGFSILSYEDWCGHQDWGSLRQAHQLESLYKKCPTDGLPLLGSVPFVYEMGYGLSGALDDASATQLAELLLASRGTYVALYMDVGSDVSLYGVVLDEEKEFEKYLRRCYVRYVDESLGEIRRSLI
jgi:hypothetical protein